MYRRPLRGWAKHIDFIFIDTVCMHLAFILAYFLRHGFDQFVYAREDYRTIAMFLTLANVVVAIGFNTFSKVLQRGRFQELTASLKHALLVFAIISAYMFSTQTGGTYSRITIYLTALLHFGFTWLARQAYKALRLRRGMPGRSMVILSTKDEAAEAVRCVRADRSGSIQLAGVAVMDEAMAGQSVEGVPVVADRDTVDQYICREWVDEVFVRLPQGDAADVELYRSLKAMGVTIHIDAQAYETMAGLDLMLEKIGSSMVLTTSMKVATPMQLLVKRLTDIVGGVVGSVLTVFIAIVIGPVIWCQSRGPLFFVQERIGLNGKRFKMIKFRSMYLDAEERKKELLSQNRVGDGRMFKLEWDPRVIGNRQMSDGSYKTGVGEFIRKTSLDEFPQFFNVLKGDMSLVGTRPPTVDEWEQYELHHRARLATKPGITGMWQVSGRSEITDFEEVTRLDTEYITNWSLWLDFKILLKTVRVVLGHKGAM